NCTPTAYAGLSDVRCQMSDTWDISHLRLKTEYPATSRVVLLVAADENFSRLGSVRGADDTVALHRIQKAGCTAISDAQAALKDRGRGLAHFDHDSPGFLVQLVDFAVRFVQLCPLFG